MAEHSVEHGAGDRRVSQNSLAEREKLGGLLASLHREKLTPEDRDEVVAEILSADLALRALVAAIEDKNRRLEEQTARLEEERDLRIEEQARLQRQLQSMEDEIRGSSARCAAVERRNSNLANLRVASDRLHCTLDRREVLTAVREIIADLVGSEEMAIFDLDREGAALSLVAAFGIDPARYRRIPLGSGIIGRVGLTGEPHVAGQQVRRGARPEEADLTACIPLKLDGRVTGAIAVFHLLPQKAGLEDVDNELFELLTVHAATALYSTGLHAGLAAGAGALASVR